MSLVTQLHCGQPGCPPVETVISARTRDARLSRSFSNAAEAIAEIDVINAFTDEQETDHGH